jgi:phosphohistidine phosphatase
VTAAGASRTLWLLRHATAVADPPHGGDDFDRVLAPRGRRDATALGLLLGSDGQGLGLGLDLGELDLPQIAFVSPAARTLATAELVLGSVVRPPVVESPDDLYGAGPEEVLTHLRAVKGKTSSVMVVGHNPTAQALALGLLTADDDAGRELVVRRGVPTCALAIYRLEVAHWRDLGAQTATLLGLFVPPFEVG